METAKKFKTVDEYLDTFPPPVKKLLQQLRTAIQNAAPEAKELISYNMPAIKGNGILVYYAAAKNHIGFYPTPSAIEAFKKELSAYKSGKGSVQFPPDEPLPLALIAKIVGFRVSEDLEKAKLKKKKK